MGADYFETTWAGRDAAEAFRFCTEEARHLEGHGGYTGTIAEKSSFRLFHLPARVPFPKFMKWVWAHQDLELAQTDARHTIRYDGCTKAEAKKARARVARAERPYNRIPVEHRALVRP